MTKLNSMTIDSPLTAFGQVLNAEMSPIIQQSFEYTVDNTELTVNAVTGGGTVTQADAMAVVGTSITTGSTAYLRSKKVCRYRSAQGAIMYFTMRFTPGVSGTDSIIGMADELGSSEAFKNGLMVGDINGQFGFHRFNNDTRATVNRADWDDPFDGTGPSALTLAELEGTKLNIGAIRFGYLGILNPELFVVTSDNVLRRAHMMVTIGQLDTPHSHNPNYYFSMWSDNGATTSDIVLRNASFGYFVEGKTELLQVHQPQFTSGIQSKTAITTEVAIFTIRNKVTYAGKANFIEIILESAYASVEASGANNLAELRLVRNATLGGSPTFNDINTTDSVIDIDTAATTVTGGTTLLGTALAGKNDREAQNLLPYKFILEPGETLTIAAQSASSATIKSGILWKELF